MEGVDGGEVVAMGRDWLTMVLRFEPRAFGPFADVTVFAVRVNEADFVETFWDTD